MELETPIRDPQPLPADVINNNPVLEDYHANLIDLVQIDGLIETVTVIPTHVPKSFEQQVKLYVDSITAPTTYIFYVYSNKTNTWSAFPQVIAPLAEPKSILSYDFMGSGGYTSFTSGGGFTGVNTIGTLGLDQDTGTTSSSYAKIRINVGSSGSGNAKLLSRDPKLFANLMIQTLGGTNNVQGIICIGNPAMDGSSLTITDEHIGFWIERTSTWNLWASCADGATQSKTLLTTLTGNDELELILELTSGSSASFYWRKNGGALSSATVITTNLPSTDTDYILSGVTTQSQSDRLQWYLKHIVYRR